MMNKNFTDDGIQRAYEKLKRTHVYFNKPFDIFFFEREDGKPLASNDPMLREEILKADREQFEKTNKVVDIRLSVMKVNEQSDLSTIRKRHESGEIKLVMPIEYQLIIELFEQAGLTYTVVDPEPAPVSAGV